MNSAALILKEMGLDAETIAACLLYGEIKNAPRDLSGLEQKHGKNILFLVENALKLDEIKYSGTKERAENLIKMFLVMAQDIRVVLIKLADRYREMHILDKLPEENRKRIALETLDIYAPIANRFGIGELKGRLEDEAFKHLYPKEHKWLEKEVSVKYEARKNYVKKIEPIIRDILKKENIIPLEINARTKHFYSLYKKLERHQMDLEKIHDLVAARVIVKNINDCYLALGAINQAYKPLPEFINDYIAMPKPNGYQSLHTTVFGPDEKIIEIQIRTRQMHNRAENGIAAHWAYKERENKNSRAEANTRNTIWIEQLREWQKIIPGSDEFFESFKIDIFKDRVFVLTPKGDVIDLPEGATPVDFAYQIHTDIGNRCAGVKINGKIATLDAELKSGDLVEILTQKNKKPSADWLNFVKTDIAKDRIKSAAKEKNKKLIFRT